MNVLASSISCHQPAQVGGGRTRRAVRVAQAVGPARIVEEGVDVMSEGPQSSRG